MTFPSPAIVGHHHQIKELQENFRSGNVPHTYLFTGPPHIGKFTVARWFARMLLTSDHSPEETIRAEAAIDRLLHPDLLVLDRLWVEGACEDWKAIALSSNVPQHHRGKSPPAKTDTISIDDVRALQGRLYETCIGRYHCCLIRSLERLQDSAAHALLKILEEPPAGRVFLLTADHERSLLPTITSRTRILSFDRVPLQDMAGLLVDTPEEDRPFLLQLSQGAPGMLIRLRDDPDVRQYHRSIRTKALAFVTSRSVLERMALLSPLLEKGANNDLLLHIGLTLRELKPAGFLQWVTALHTLVRDLSSNVHRPLALQRFALGGEGLSQS